MLRTFLNRWSPLSVIGLLIVLSLCGCGDSAKKPTGGDPAENNAEVVITGDDTWQSLHSTLQRNLTPDDSDLGELVRGNHEFTLALYRTLIEGKDESENLLVSPLSIRTAFAMVHAGARGETETEMAEALCYGLGQTDLHNAYNVLDLELAKRNHPGDAEWDPVEIYVANAFWGEITFPFRKEYLDVLAENYGCGIEAMDYRGAFEAAREIINGWVEDRTMDRIQNLLPAGSLDALTRAVITNALYLKAPWASPFNELDTQDGPFYLLDGGTVSVPMMWQDEYYPYVEGDGYQAVELNYHHDELSMVILLPASGSFSEFESSLDADRLAGILSDLGDLTKIALTLPSFSFESSFRLKETLKAMGMEVPFIPCFAKTLDPCADFSGMIDADDRHLYISEAFHKTFIAVDEKGTEAAAATAVVVSETSIVQNQLKADRPFLFLIRDRATGAILFFGRVMNPEA